MRCARWLRCASTAAATTSVLPSPSASDATAATTTTATAVAVRAFAAMRLQPWQRQAVRDVNTRAELPIVLLYHGTHLGPRPLLLLDHSVPHDNTHTAAAAATTTTTDATAAIAACEATARSVASKYEAMLTHTAWPHGVVHVSLPVRVSRNAQTDVLAQSCRVVCAVMDALGVRWTHFLTHGYGALVAARMACTDATLHRVGTIVSLDTPLATSAMLTNAQRRRELAAAAADVNVDRDTLCEAQAQLCRCLEPPLPHVAAADEALYTHYLFDHDALYSNSCSSTTSDSDTTTSSRPQQLTAATAAAPLVGLVRDESRYVPLRRLAALRHPLQLIAPAAGAVADVAAHKTLVGLRRAAVIKTAMTHDALFAHDAAAEVGGVIAAWLHRFEPDTFLRRRYEQSAQEMAQLMGGGGGGDAASLASKTKGGGGGGGGDKHGTPRNKKKTKTTKDEKKAAKEKKAK